jgi:hypothetical protein
MLYSVSELVTLLSIYLAAIFYFFCLSWYNLEVNFSTFVFVKVRTHLADGCLDVLEVVSLLLQLEGQLLHLSSVAVRVDLQINLEVGLHNSTYMQSWPPVEEYN